MQNGKISKCSSELTKYSVSKIFTILQDLNPHPTTELEYTSNFELLIAVILSAQATDVSVNKATCVLYKIANTPETVLALGVEGLSDYIKSIGLFNTKAKNVIATCQILLDKFEGIVPNNREDLMSLPGVGRKTANVVLNTAFGLPEMAVDTHIFRVANRLGLTKAKDVLESEQQLLAIIPKKFLQDAHHWLILHGRYVCRAKKPKCSDCCLAKYCKSYTLFID